MLAVNRFLKTASQGFRWTVCAGYTVFIAVMSLRPRATLIHSPFEHSDKVGHFGAYGVMAALLLWTLPFRPAAKWRWFALTVALCGGYGIVMEILQATTSAGVRTGSVADAAANLAGAACVAAVAVGRPDLLAGYGSK